MSIRSGIRVGRVIAGVAAGLAILVAGVFVVVDQIGLPLGRRIFVAEAAPVVPLRSPLAALPESLSDWVRAKDAQGKPIPDARYGAEMIEALGTDEYLERRYERGGRVLAVRVAYHTGDALDETPILPETCWLAASRRGEPRTLRQELTVGITEAAGGHGDRRVFGAGVILAEGRSEVFRRWDPHHTDYFAAVEISNAGDASAFDTFLTDIDDLMPRVVAELQNTCLPLPVPLPVEAVPTD